MVTVVMTTYDDGNGERYKYAARCVDSLTQHLKCPRAKHLIITDDGSLDTGPLEQILRDRLQIIDPRKDTPFERAWDNTRLQFGPHGGIGSSLNRALATLEPDEPWLYTTDDWLLTGPLDLTQPLQLLDKGYDLVRIGPIHPNITCYTRFEVGIGWWLALDIYSNQYACATRPFLASPRLMQKVGRFTEGVDSYQAEVDFGYDCQARNVAAAAVTLHGPWEHIGEYEVGDRPISV